MSLSSSFISNPNGPLAQGGATSIPKPASVKKKKKGLKRSRIKKKYDPEKASADQQINAEAFLRDGNKCILCSEGAAHGHHVIPKKAGGRGSLSEIVDSVYLRVTLCESCHHDIHHSDKGANPYVFYVKAMQDGYLERVILLEMLVDEWAKWIPEDDLAKQIRQRNQERWERMGLGDVPVTGELIRDHWEEILEMEVRGWI